MSWTTTDALREQTANAAASAENEHFELCGDTHSVYEHIADAVLVAVGPHIAADAWDEGVTARGHYDGYTHFPAALGERNPYRQEAGR